MDEKEKVNLDELRKIMERLSPSDYVTTMLPDRPYDGQPHTDTGERGATEVRGLTLRDLRDCYVRACFLSSGLFPSEWPGSVYELPWEEMDPLAVFQNMSCEIERRMGIFPNIEPHRYNCSFCDSVFRCDAAKAYLCQHDHWQDWVDHMWSNHCSEMEADGQTPPYSIGGD